MEAGFGLEPLAGEPRRGRGAGRYSHPAEGQVADFPDLCPRRIRRKHRPADVVGADEGHHPALDDRDRLPAVPDVFPDQRAGAMDRSVDLGGLSIVYFQPAIEKASAYRQLGCH